MNKDQPSQSNKSDESQNKPKKPLSIGLFAGMNVKKKPANPLSQKPTSPNKSTDTPENKSAVNKESQNSSIDQIPKFRQEKILKDAPETKILVDDDDIIDFSDKKNSQLPYFKTTNTSVNPQGKNLENNLPIFQAKNEKISKIKNLNQDEKNGPEEKESDDILDFDINNLEIRPNDSQKSKGNKINLGNSNNNLKNNSQNDSFEFPSNTKKSQNTIEKPTQNQSTKGNFSSFSNTNNSETEKAKIKESEHKKNFPDQNPNEEIKSTEKIEKNLVPQQKEISSEPTKKPFSFIKKDKETQRPTQNSKSLNQAEKKSDRLLEEETIAVQNQEFNANENSLNECSNTLEKINKDLSDISERDGFKDKIDKSPDSKDSLKDEILSNSMSKKNFSFSEQIKRDFKVKEIEGRVKSRFERFLIEIFSSAKNDNNNKRLELTAEQNKRELSAKIKSIEQEIQAKLAKEDYLSAEGLQNQVDELSAELNKLLEPVGSQAKQTKTADKSLAEISFFEKQKAEFNSELNKLMGDKIFIKEKRLFFEENSKERFQRKTEEIETAKAKTKADLENIQRQKSSTEKILQAKQSEKEKEEEGFHSKINTLELGKEQILSDLQELRIAIVKKENELFELNKNIESAKQKVERIELKYESQLSKLSAQKAEEEEAETALNAKFEELKRKEQGLKNELENVEQEILKTDSIINEFDKLREIFKAEFESFEGLFNQFLADKIKENSARAEFLSARKDFEAVEEGLEQLREKISLFDKKTEETNKELEKVQIELPKIESQKKEAVRLKNFSLANFYSKEQKNLEQTESNLKEQLKAILVEQEEVNKEIPLFEELVLEKQVLFIPEQISYQQTVINSIETAKSLLTKIEKFNPILVKNIAEEINFCEEMINKLREQNARLNSQLQKLPKAERLPIKKSLDSSFSARKENFAGSDKEVKELIREDNEEEAWENYISLYRISKAINELEIQLTSAIQTEDFEAAAILQEKVDGLALKKSELSKQAEGSQAYLKGTQDELKESLLEFIKGKIKSLENKEENEQDFEGKLFDLQIKKYKDLLNEFS